MRLLSIAISLVGCAAGLLGAPVITGVTNAASNLPPGLPNSGIAQGAIMAIYGSGLGPPTLQQTQKFPFPTTQGLAGTTVNVTVGGVTTACVMYYTSAAQVAAVLPSATPVGSGTLTVSYEGQSGSIAIQVAAAGFGTIALNGSGTGPAVVTNAYYTPLTFVNPAHPGQTVILWGSGLGPVTGDETEPPVEVDLGTGVQVFVGGQPANVSYGGRSGDPGLDQINFTIPATVTTACRVSIAVLEKGIVGNITTMAIAPAGQTTCDDGSGVLTSANLQKAVATGTLNAGTIFLYRFGSNADTITGGFGSYPLNSLLRSWGGDPSPSSGSCTAYELLGTETPADPIVPPTLDAGPQLVVTGPGGSRTIPTDSNGLFYATLGSAGSFIQPGAYTVTNGAGGANVAGFTWNLMAPAPITFTNLPNTINRAQDLTLNWTNSSAFQGVSIFGISGVPLSSGQTVCVEFFCTAPASASQFTIPSEILKLIPPNGYGYPGQHGVSIQIAGVSSNSYTVPGSPGIDAGFFSLASYTATVVGVQ
jgi:uncharacterized protein (TIGR03437 family)